MPVILTKKTGNSTLVLWQITEDEPALRRNVAPEDIAEAQKIKHPGRRIERLAWRAAIRTIVPEITIAYTDTGRPFALSVNKQTSHNGTGNRAEPSTPHISASHTTGYAATIVAQGPCAVDIERRNRSTAHVVSKYIHSEEQKLEAAIHPDFPILVWCAKETLYKLAAEPGIDFVQDLRIREIHLAPEGDHGTITATINSDRQKDTPQNKPRKNNQTVVLAFLFTHDLCIVYTPY